MMKNILLRVLRILIWPLAACYRIIQEAPVISCDDELIGFSAYSRRSPVQSPSASGTCPKHGSCHAH